MQSIHTLEAPKEVPKPITRPTIFGNKKLSVKEDGIYRVKNIYYSDTNEVASEMTEMVMPKEIFIEAYNKYIKDSLESD